MDILIVGVVGIFFFVLGVALIYRGMANSPDADEVVQKVEYEDVRSKLDNVEKEEKGLKLQLDSMTVELQDAQVRAQEADVIKKDVDSLRERDRQHQEMIHSLEENLNFLSKKADEQAKKSIDAILALDSKSKKLQGEAQEYIEQALQVDVEGLSDEKDSLKKQLAGNVEKLNGLQAELMNVQQRSEAELQESKALVEKLRSENEVFEKGIVEITSKITSVEEEFSKVQQEKDQQLQNAKQLIDKLRTEQQHLTQDGASKEQVVALESELNRIKAESEGRLLEAHQNVGRLQEEVNRFQREIQENQHQRVELQNQIDENQRSISAVDEDAMTEVIENQKAKWVSEKLDIDLELSELRETTQFLRQKERLLSQELLRSQTQALGLEKICQEFKKQIERG